MFSSSRHHLTTTLVTRTKPLHKKYDAIVVGGGHNGMVSAAYLAKAGKKVAVLEKRHLVGGASVTEEIVKGFKFSRASYVISLLRPQVINDLELKKHGLKLHLRNPNSFTPMDDGAAVPASLTLSSNRDETFAEIAKFSKKDAEKYFEFDAQLEHFSKAIDVLLDASPPNLSQGKLFQQRQELQKILKCGLQLGVKNFPDFYKLVTAPISNVLDEWFESEPLKATLGTDGVIGAFMSPRTPGSGYVLLHHVMGGIDGQPGAWAYAEGGNGAVSDCIGKSAQSHGVDIVTECPVDQILTDSTGKACGVKLANGEELAADIIMANTTPHITYNHLLSETQRTTLIPEQTMKAINTIDYRSPVTKINVAINKIPNFLAKPNEHEHHVQPHHQCTIHLNCEDLDIVHDAYLEAEVEKIPSRKPMIEMCMASTLDKTLTEDPNHHVVSLFTQYTPIKLGKEQRDWTPQDKIDYAEGQIFKTIDRYAPGFSESVVGYECLTPGDLEKELGLTGGNIFHGSMSLDQLFFTRPLAKFPGSVTPIKNLFVCGAGGHPGGGVMGSAGRLAAMQALQSRNVTK